VSRSVPLLAGLLLVFSSLAAQGADPRCPIINREIPPTAGAIVRDLADIQFDGRLTGTLGEHCAEDYIASAFARLGLRPAGDAGTFLQPVTVGQPTELPPANVIGILTGSDPGRRAEALVIGAHHDHLGRDSAGVVYPGADDNASGVAALLRVAEMLAADRPARTVVFVTFTAEEVGMFGSKSYVEHPAVPLGRTIGMINLDMVGRLSSRGLQISGLSTNPAWGEMVERANGGALTILLNPEVETGSDHLPFYRSGVPILYLTTGEHADHHRTTDTSDRIDSAGIEAVAKFVAALVRTYQ
jgi:hypothetical protein